MSGTLYGIGVGPGDPELLTLKAARLLASISVITYPAPLQGESLARRIAAPHIPEGREEIALRLPFTPGPRPETEYDEAAKTLGKYLERGSDVACLCEGDPLFYGSFIYLLERLSGRFAIEIVPGITSLSAGAALLRRKLVSGNSPFLVLPATRTEEELERGLAHADCAGIIKLGRHLPKLRRVLTRLDLLRSASYVERAGMEGQRICALEDIAGDDAPYFSLVLVQR